MFCKAKVIAKAENSKFDFTKVRIYCVIITQSVRNKNASNRGAIPPGATSAPMPRVFRVLPKALLSQIKANIPPRQQPGAIDAALYVLGKYFYNGVDPGQWLEISKHHFANQVGANYYRHINALEAAGVIEIDNKYIPPKFADGKKIKGQCKKYRLPLSLLISEPEIIEVLAPRGKDFDKSDIVMQTVQLLSRLTLDLSRTQISVHIADLVTAKYIESKCRINDAIAPDNYEIKGKNYPLRVWRKIASEQGKDCILYRDRLYIADKDKFISDHQKYVQIAYTDALCRLKKIEVRANIVCSRNTTNRRLDTNLTNLPSILLPLLRLDGDHLANIDLKNSQFNLLHTVMLSMCLYIKQLHGKDTNLENENAPQMLKGINVDKVGKEDRFSKVNKDLSTINVHHLFSENLCNYIENQLITAEIFSGKQNNYVPENNAVTRPSTDKILRLIGWLKKENYLESLYLAFLPFLGDLSEFEALEAELSHLAQIAQRGGYYEAMRAALTKQTGQTYTRDEVKKIAFAVAFSSWRNNRAHKRVFKQFAPLTCRLMDGFKRAQIEALEAQGCEEATDQGNASLAVMLQRLEAEIFVDGALSQLLRAGYRVFTKHDSVLCRASDLEAVTAILRASLETWFEPGGYELK